MVWHADGSHPLVGRQQYHDSLFNINICNVDLGYQATYFIKKPVESQDCSLSICFRLNVKVSLQV